MFRPMSLALALLVVSLPSAAQQVIYMSRTAEGKTVLSEQAPANALAEQPSEGTPATRPTQAPKFSPVKVPRQPAGKGAPPPRQDDVVLFAADWCAYCRQARAYLAEHRIRYAEYNVDTEEGQEAFAWAGGGKGIPFLIAGQKRLRGYSATSYDALFSSRK